ncbi:nucleic acid-binding protein [Halorussus salilacus]|uniref:Zn-ribbon domain-containing OB-fold protein n=1 Tax=Halorussus salilacus TaxID=2953750 RepID=UPI0020A00C82|nr:nucleic acid-binding protein [Halorussus salilacus]USZ68410.1 nucleic acid-binding protein [Halorussus salilacus]
MTLQAHRCPNGHLTYPGHELCPECGEPQESAVELAEEIGEVVTWTTSTATPPGVRQPNTLAIVEFSLDEAQSASSSGAESDGAETVRAIGQVVEDSEVEIGDEVRPVYAEELRDPEAGIREKESQDWDGYRFEPV